jgi:hypothetical protein
MGPWALMTGAKIAARMVMELPRPTNHGAGQFAAIQVSTEPMPG